GPLPNPKTIRNTSRSKDTMNGLAIRGVTSLGGVGTSLHMEGPTHLWHFDPLPVARDDQLSGAIQGQVLNFSAPGVLGNDTLAPGVWGKDSLNRAELLSYTPPVIACRQRNGLL